MIDFLIGIAVGLLTAGLIALYRWHLRNPMTPEERQAVDDEMRIW